jgi:hypothetical protein
MALGLLQQAPASLFKLLTDSTVGFSKESIRFHHAIAQGFGIFF